MSAIEKLNLLWRECLIDNTVEPQSWDLPNLFTQNMGTSFNRLSDELPAGRPKINHSRGVVSLVSWEDLGNHNYTGLYDGGSDVGLLRLSEGNFILPDTPGLTPSLAIKFLRTGMESVNQLANVSFEPTDSWNFFENHFHTRVNFFTDQCAIDTIQRKFLEVTSTIQSLGLAEFARFRTNGQAENNVTFPFDLHFVPHPAMAARYPSTRQAGNGFLR